MEPAASRLTALDDALLARVLAFLCAREVEAAAVAVRVVAREVLPRFPHIWAALFRHRWEALNFPLGDARLVINRRLRARFSPSCSDSRLFQLLTHAVTPLPAYADLQRTRRARGFDAAKHEVTALHDPDTRESQIVSFGFGGHALGDDRCVRANAPFPATFHVGVFRRREGIYEIGLVASGYFEVSISARCAPRLAAERSDVAEAGAGGDVEGETWPQEELASIGLVSDSFPLVGRQPGWNQHSFGYHSDNGHVYLESAQGEYFGPRFGAGDTVGCGVRRDQRHGRSAVFFTLNGQRMARTGGGEMACQHASLYPAVGLDSFQQATVNFGQRAFAHDAIVDELFAECDAAFDACAAGNPEQALPWFDVSDGNAAWRRLRARGLLERLVSAVTGEEIDEYGEEVTTDKDCPAVMPKWIGLLTRRRASAR